MFGFGKKKDPEKRKSAIDKIIMGAIVGGAVGSVIGMSIAPKKGKETREYLTQKGKQIFEKGKEFNEKIHQGIETVNEKKPGFFKRIKNRIFRRNKALEQQKAEFKKIPTEQPEEHNIQK